MVDGLVLRYDLTQTSGTAVADSSGNGRTGTLVGGGTWTGDGGLALDGVDDHVKLPNNVMAGLSSITVSRRRAHRPGPGVAATSSGASATPRSAAPRPAPAT